MEHYWFLLFQNHNYHTWTGLIFNYVKTEPTDIFNKMNMSSPEGTTGVFASAP